MKRFTLFTLLALLPAALWLVGCGEHAHDHEHGEACDHGEKQTLNAQRSTLNAQGEEHEHGEECDHDHEEVQTLNAQRSTLNAQAKEHEHGEACSHAQDSEAFTMPESAQRLLGLSVVTAMPRRVTGTVRFPGRFELMPDARRAYSAPLPGVVEVRVRPPQRVAAGEVLFTLHAPEWARVNGEVRDAAAALALLKAESEALRKRLSQLREAGVRHAELEQQLAVKAAEAERAEQTRQNADAARAAILALCREQDGVLAVTAREAGVIERVPVASGTWVDAGTEVAAVVRSDRLWFRADGIPAELGQVRDGQTGFVEPLTAHGAQPPAAGRVELGFATDDAVRIHPLYLLAGTWPDWAGPGRSGVLSVVIEESAPEQIALPEACVVTDGLRQIVFVRDPHDAQRLIKREIAPGASDGDWVAVKGVTAGEAVVLDGAYELKLAAPSAGTSQRAAGHFHADGQFHEGEH
ncbi:MAG TPA: efflux RND transporter periplasmic adaptor subunit [Kiritimatiellia bacterium]|nr:efflux RND transporter periplasmic adaptor subunit [Kiritimatiellia bacterium]